MTSTKRKIYLIPELLSLTGISDEQRGNMDLMKKVADLSRADPRERFLENKRLADTVNKIDKGDKTASVGSVVQL